jgi:hypothetical protein
VINTIRILVFVLSKRELRRKNGNEPEFFFILLKKVLRFKNGKAEKQNYFENAKR